MQQRIIRSACLAVISSAALYSTAWGYDNKGPSPAYHPVHAPAPLWTNADVDRLVETKVVTINAKVPASQFGAPAACDKISFLRMKLKSASDNAEQADAALLLTPGILEGAGAFTYIGRQLVYMAQKNLGKTIEVWGMDRRSNCLEDPTGMRAAEKATTTAQAEDVMVNYYYKGAAIDGKKFAGFLKPDQAKFLAEFGMAQATEDMLSIIKSMMPTPGMSKRKAFIGGHSLGGIHASTFLSWDFDGDPKTTDDAGYNQVAGAVGLETILTSVADIPKVLFAMAPGLVNTAHSVVDSGYVSALAGMRNGTVSTETYAAGLIGPEVLALPAAMGVLASKGQHDESFALRKIGTLSPELDGFTRLLSSRDMMNWFYPPHFKDYRYTNAALIGMVFSKHFTPLSFLQAGLGFTKGGNVAIKNAGMVSLQKIPLLGNLMAAAVSTGTSWATIDAGPNSFALGQGPLYDWMSRDEIGASPTDALMDTTGKITFTTLQSEPGTMSDFIEALHAPLDVTEWYFPLRILIDCIDMSAPTQAISHGMNVFYPDAPQKVPTLLINGDQGILTAQGLSVFVPKQANLIVAPGFAHMDPMFETVTSPSQVDYVMQPIINFMISNAH